MGQELGSGSDRGGARTGGSDRGGARTRTMTCMKQLETIELSVTQSGSKLAAVARSGQKLISSV